MAGAKKAMRTIHPFIGFSTAKRKGILRGELDFRAREFYKGLMVLNRHHPKRLKLRVNSELKLIPEKLKQLRKRAQKTHEALWRETQTYDSNGGVKPEVHTERVNQYVRIVGQEMALFARLQFLRIVKLNEYKLAETFRILQANKGDFEAVERFLNRVHQKR